MKHTLTLLTTVLLAPLAALHAADQPAKKPNVVLFLVDDMGWMDCGAYGSRYYKTPHMDAFAKQSMRFTDAYAMPLCSPTRASILSGQGCYDIYPTVLDLAGLPLPPQQKIDDGQCQGCR